MNNLKGINIRLYPNTSQQIYLAKLFGCQRFVYNSCLDLKIKKYNDSKEILGINSYLTDSNNQKIENPKWLRKKVKGLKHYQQILSKKTKGSKNYKKVKAKIAKTHEKIVNQRKNFLHNLSSKIISENQVICLENLAIKEMIKKHSLAGAIQELSWYEFKVQLTYKAKWYNRDLILVDRYYPSTKTCSRCKNKQEIGLDERTYVCESCGLEIDRDYNASLNILNEGLRILSRRSDSHNLVL